MTQAVLGNLIPDTSYNIQVELVLIYNITIKSDAQYFQTKEGKRSSSTDDDDDNDVIVVVGSVVGTSVAIAIALSLITFCLKHTKKTGDETGSDNGRPYLQDLIEMRTYNRGANQVNAEGTPNNVILAVWISLS
jgi:hypothetical protein